MDCLVTLLSICLFDPAGLTVEADASWQLNSDTTHWVMFEPYRGAIGRLSISVDVPMSDRLTLRYGFEHRSAIETSRDRGEERAALGFVWRPFRR